MEKYIVKAYEEELGEEYLEVFVPLGTPKAELMKNFNMAKKYSTVCEYSDPKNYDEHFDDMLDFRETSNGLDAFCYYLEEFCGYSVVGLECDLEFEW